MTLSTVTPKKNLKKFNVCVRPMKNSLLNRQPRKQNSKLKRKPNVTLKQRNNVNVMQNWLRNEPSKKQNKTKRMQPLKLNARSRTLSQQRNLKHRRKLSEFNVKPSRKKMLGWLKKNVLLMKRRREQLTKHIAKLLAPPW